MSRKQYKEELAILDQKAQIIYSLLSPEDKIIADGYKNKLEGIDKKESVIHYTKLTWLIIRAFIFLYVGFYWGGTGQMICLTYSAYTWATLKIKQGTLSRLKVLQENIVIAIALFPEVFKLWQHIQ